MTTIYIDVKTTYFGHCDIERYRLSPGGFVHRGLDPVRGPGPHGSWPELGPATTEEDFFYWVQRTETERRGHRAEDLETVRV
jgi:hypothetical protein